MQEQPLNLVEGGRAKAALEVHNDFASETETLTIDTHNMAGFVVIVWDDEGVFNTAMCNGVRSPYAKELAGMLLAKKVEHLFFKEDE